MDAQNATKTDILATSSLLQQIARVHLQQLAQHARISEHKKNTLLFQKGDPGANMMAVIDGRIRIYSTSLEGKELTLNIIGPGEFFGEIALLDGQARTADAMTIEPCTLLILDRRSFLPWLEQHPQVAIGLLSVLCQRLRRTSGQLEETLFLDLPARLASCLVRLGETFGETVADGIQINLRLSQQQLGALMGITRESTNKYLGELQEEGLVSARGRQLVIHDMDTLKAMAGGDLQDDEDWDA